MLVGPAELIPGHSHSGNLEYSERVEIAIPVPFQHHSVAPPSSYIDMCSSRSQKKTLRALDCQAAHGCMAYSIS